MTLRSALLVACLLLSVPADAQKDQNENKPKKEKEESSQSCEAVEAQVSSLKAEIASLKTQLDAAKAAGGSTAQVVSPLGAVSGIAGFGQDVMQHLLDQTSHDEALTEAVSRHATTAKELALGARDQIMAVDYRGHAKTLTDHPIYTTHVGPTLGKVQDAVQPHLDAHVYPALEKAKPHVASAHEATMKVLSDGFPLLHKTGSDFAAQLPKHLDTAEQGMGKLIAPVFDFSKKAAPKHAEVMPTRPLDRLILLLFTVMLTYYSLKVGIIVARIALRVFRVVSKVAIKLLKLAISIGLLPVWVLDCCVFRCCGLRKRKSKHAEPKKGKDKNGKAPDAKKGPAPKASLADVTALLEASKKKGKLEPAVKLLAGVAGKGTTMDGDKFPKDVQGKTLEKDVLKKAITGKFKEIDVKKFNL